VEKLLRCLRASMPEPAVPEIAHQLQSYFKVLRRRRGESMAAFCVWHREEYASTCKAMTRVMKDEETLQHQSQGAWHSDRRLSRSTLEQHSSARSSGQGGPSDLATEAQDEDPTQGGDTEDGTQDEEAWTDEDWCWRWGSQWMYPWHYDMEQASSWETEEDNTIDPEEDDEDFVEILPDVIKGWLLLEKANVDHMERSLIPTREPCRAFRQGQVTRKRRSSRSSCKSLCSLRQEP
jgi:hypothetical protein